jgi:hypothetical protein
VISWSASSIHVARAPVAAGAADIRAQAALVRALLVRLSERIKEAAIAPRAADHR